MVQKYQYGHTIKIHQLQCTNLLCRQCFQINIVRPSMLFVRHLSVINDLIITSETVLAVRGIRAEYSKILIGSCFLNLAVKFYLLVVLATFPEPSSPFPVNKIFHRESLSGEK